MIDKNGSKQNPSFIAAATILLLLAGLLIGGFLKGGAPAASVSGILMGGSCGDYLKTHENLDDAVGKAVISRETSYLRGEFSAEGHIILGVREKGRTVTVYTMASFGAYGFENGIFARIGGSGAIPTVMTFSADAESGYTLTDYKEPLDGAYYLDSVRKTFPESLWDRVLKDSNENAGLGDQQQAQAEAYLRTIGRDAEVSVGPVEKQLPSISTAASNKIFAEFMKFDPELNKFPYWIGTREEVENGSRTIYRTAQDKDADGSDMIVFTKMSADGTVLSEKRYKIQGDEPVLLP